MANKKPSGNSPLFAAMSNTVNSVTTPFVGPTLPVPHKPSEAQMWQMHALLADATKKFNAMWADANHDLAGIVGSLPAGIHYRVRATIHPEDPDALRLFVCRVTKGLAGAKMPDPKAAAVKTAKTAKKVVKGKGGKIKHL